MLQDFAKIAFNTTFLFYFSLVCLYLSQVVAWIDIWRSGQAAFSVRAKKPCKVLELLVGFTRGASVEIWKPVFLLFLFLNFCRLL